jgi:hypothetical protein
MGAGGSVPEVPEVIDSEAAKKLCGDAWDEEQFNRLAVDGKITKQQFEEVADRKKKGAGGKRASMRRTEIVDTPMTRIRSSMVDASAKEKPSVKADEAPTDAAERAEYMFKLFVGFVNWVIEVQDDGKWFKGKATKYQAVDNMITIEVGEMEGEVELDFSFVKLVSVEDDNSVHVFDHLMTKQVAEAAVTTGGGTEAAKPAHDTDNIDGYSAVTGIQARSNSIIGAGLTGCVKLIQATDGSLVALKVLMKKKIVKLKQAQNVMKEKEIMGILSEHPFVVKLMATHQVLCTAEWVMKTSSQSDEGGLSVWVL